MNTRAAAEQLAATGLVPVAVVTRGKRPCAAGWQLTTEATWRETLTESHTGEVGILTGEPSGCVVLDIDVADGGLLAWGSAVAEHGDPALAAGAVVARTGGGGLHYYFALDEGTAPLKNGARLARSTADGEAVGWDIRTTGGFVVAPPSLHASGRRYEWIHAPQAGVALPVMPPWVRARLAVAATPEPCHGNAGSRGSVQATATAAAENEAALQPAPLYGDVIKVRGVDTVVDLGHVTETLAAIPGAAYSDASQWGALMTHVKSLVRSGDARDAADDVAEAFDAWSRGVPGYDAADNARRWRAVRQFDGYSWDSVVARAVNATREPLDLMSGNLCALIKWAEEAFRTRTPVQPAVVAAQVATCVGRIRSAREEYVVKRRTADGKAFVYDRVDNLRGLGSYQVPEADANDPEGKLAPLSKLVARYAPNYRAADVYATPLGAPLAAVPEVINTFPGYMVGRTAGDLDAELVEAFERHILDVWAGGDAAAARYILGWFGSLLGTGDLPGTALIVKSDLEGTGKNSITDFLSREVFGALAVTTSAALAFGRFNGVVEGRRLVVVDEVDIAAGDWHAFHDRVKLAITTERMPIELKGKDSHDVRNSAGYVIFSNHAVPVKLGAGARRFAVFEASACRRGDRPYFDGLRALFARPHAGAHIAEALVRRHEATPGWNPRELPETEARRVLAEDSLDATARWLLGAAPFSLESAAAYTHFVEWARVSGERAPPSAIVFGRDMKRYGAERNRKRVGGRLAYVYEATAAGVRAQLAAHLGHEPREQAEVPNVQAAPERQKRATLADVYVDDDYVNGLLSELGGY